jgi:integrase
MSKRETRGSGLTAIAVKHAKPRDKPYKLSDRDALYLFVKPSGARSWRMNYRFDGVQRTLSLGRWPEVSLADARERVINARRLLSDRIDPSEQVRLDKIKASIARANTFKSVADDWLKKVWLEQRSARTIRKYEWQLSLVMPTLGKRPISEISAHEVLLALKRIERTGKYYTACSVRATCSQVFRYAIATARAERDVCADLRGALVTPKVVHRPAITEPRRVGALMRALGEYDGAPMVRVAVRLLPHLFVRPGELRHAEWQEFDFERAVWMIPDYKMKMGRPHAVPLSRQSLAIIGELQHDPSDSRYLFPSLRTGDRPMSDGTINAALRRLGYTRDEMTAHGFRAMAATLLNEMGLWNPDAIERQLAHVEVNAVRRAYSRGQYWEERVRMMQHWSDYLDELRGSVPAQRPQLFHRQA